MTAGMTGGLGNAADNPEAVKLLKQGIRNNDDVAEAYLNRVRPELRGINNEAAGMVDNSCVGTRPLRRLYGRSRRR